MGVMRTLTINGVTYNVVPIVPAARVTLVASAWLDEGERYSQVVAIPGVTASTKVDLQPTADQLAEFHHKVLGFVAENDGGLVTVYAIGDKPKNNHTMQVTLTEVEGTGKIRGNTVGTTTPRSNLSQDDPSKADYVKGREGIVRTVNGASPDENGNVEVASSGSGGKDGKDGKDGISATHSWSGTTLTITSASGTSSADLKGEAGKDGQNGVTPVRGVDYFNEEDINVIKSYIDGLFVPLTQEEYDALATVDPNKYYMIVGDSQ